MPRMASASAISASVGGMTGMIELIKEFVILDERPMMLTGVGIRNGLGMRVV
jgi:hypothetical protein